MSISVRCLAWLLHHSNARMSHATTRAESYALKESILRRYGRLVGTDVQRIIHECYGYASDGHCRGEHCTKCGGTGIWDQRWIALERWQMAGYIFHRPIGPTRPRAVDYIDGRITHETSARAAADALFWLLLLYDRRLWWRELANGGRFCGWQWRPMLALQSIVMQARGFWSTVSRRCSCGRLIIRPFQKGHWMICRHCEAESARQWAALSVELADDDLPF